MTEESSQFGRPGQTAYSLKEVAYSLLCLQPQLPTARQALPTPARAYLPTIALLLHLVLPEGSR